MPSNPIFDLAEIKQYSKLKFRLISIENDGYHLMITVKINGKPANMLIDTGASKTVFDLTRIRKYIEDKSGDFEKFPQLSTGLGTNTLESHSTVIKKLVIGGYLEKNFRAILLDLANINQSYKLLKIKPIDGVIGSDLLVQSRAQINFLTKTIKVYF